MAGLLSDIISMRKYGLISTLANNPLTSELMINAKDEKLAYIANGVLPTGIKTLGEQKKEKASKEIQIDIKKKYDSLEFVRLRNLLQNFSAC